MSDEKIYTSTNEGDVALPDCGYVKAGFPSPADDMPFPTLDLNRRLVRNPASTFYMTVSGDSMSGDVLTMAICWSLIVRSSQRRAAWLYAQSMASLRSNVCKSRMTMLCYCLPIKSINPYE